MMFSVKLYRHDRLLVVCLHSSSDQAGDAQKTQNFADNFMNRFKLLIVYLFVCPFLHFPSQGAERKIRDEERKLFRKKSKGWICIYFNVTIIKSQHTGMTPSVSYINESNNHFQAKTAMLES